jgi:protein-L-isoaspartate(D-aspartate) O-methyltransferase
MHRSLRRVARFAIAGPWTVAGISCAAADSGGAPAPAAVDADLQRRIAMVASQIESRGIRDGRVLDALRRVPRHRFVPLSLYDEAYSDRPLPIGHDQTISQPYIVALMTEAIRPHAQMKVLEIGTGSGYQAAILGECTREVYTIEIVPELARRSAELLSELGYANVHVRAGDGFDGWPEQAPFDAIVVTAAPADIPEPLLAQLAPGGRLVIPVGVDTQDLVLVERTAEGLRRRTITAVRFVPMTGKARGD